METENPTTTIKLPPMTLPKNPSDHESWEKRAYDIQQMSGKLGIDTEFDYSRVCDVCDKELPLTSKDTDYTCECGFVSDICRDCQKVFFNNLEKLNPTLQERFRERKVYKCPGNVGCSDVTTQEIMQKYSMQVNESPF